jgi:hypothetical protein
MVDIGMKTPASPQEQLRCEEIYCNCRNTDFLGRRFWIYKSHFHSTHDYFDNHAEQSVASERNWQ